MCLLRKEGQINYVQSLSRKWSQLIAHGYIKVFIYVICQKYVNIIAIYKNNLE